MVVQKDKDELLVDVGGKSEGVLPFRELSLAVDPKVIKVGDTLEVMIHRIDEMDGTLFLSERRARALKSTWCCSPAAAEPRASRKPCGVIRRSRSRFSSMLTMTVIPPEG